MAPISRASMKKSGCVMSNIKVFATPRYIDPQDTHIDQK